MANENAVFVGVHLDASGRARPAGILTFSEPGENRAWFEYNPAYLGLISAGAAYALDPVNLPPRGGVLPLPSAAHPGVFGDGASDFWGQLVLRRLLGIVTPTPVQRLVHSGEDRIGVLAFQHRTIKPKRMGPASAAILDRYARFIRSFQEGSAPLSDEDMKAAALTGSSAGGARPKCTFRDDGGVFWLAKFSRPGHDPVSVPAVEHAAMALAARCGIRTARTELRHSGDDPVILVERFDRTPDNRRIAFASMQSILARTGMSDGSYPEMAKKLRQVSCRPEADAREMFRRMVFNIACGNSDDHLKNQAIVRGPHGWQLAPAYDITPQAMPDAIQSLVVGSFGAIPIIGNILSEHAAFCLSLGEAKQVVCAIQAAVADWRDHFRANGVSDDDIAMLEAGDCFDKLPPVGNPA